MDKNNNKTYNRRSIRLQGYDYSQPGAYFITLCTQNRQCLFGNVIDGKMILNDYGQIAHQCWLEIPHHYPNVELDEFIVMPNHVHGIIIIHDIDVAIESPNDKSYNNVGAIHELPLQYQKQRCLMTLPKIIGRFKMNSAKQINQLRQTMGLSVWQRNYYEHIIRNDESLHKIREYIHNNPLKWELDNENPDNILSGFKILNPDNNKI